MLTVNKERDFYKFKNRSCEPVSMELINYVFRELSKIDGYFLDSRNKDRLSAFLVKYLSGLSAPQREWERLFNMNFDEFHKIFNSIPYRYFMPSKEEVNAKAQALYEHIEPTKRTKENLENCREVIQAMFDRRLYSRDFCVEEDLILSIHFYGNHTLKENLLELQIQ